MGEREVESGWVRRREVNVKEREWETGGRERGGNEIGREGGVNEIGREGKRKARKRQPFSEFIMSIIFIQVFHETVLLLNMKLYII